MEKKITAFQIRISEEFSADFRIAAETYGLSASALARLIMERFVKARKAHGNRLVFPPEYKHFLPVDEVPSPITIENTGK
jgi:hypothetical protein